MSYRRRTKRIEPSELRFMALSACTAKQREVVESYLQRPGGWSVARLNQWPVPAVFASEFGERYSVVYLNTPDRRNFMGVKPNGQVVLAQSDNTVTVHFPWLKR